MSTRRSLRQFEPPDMVGLCPSGHGDEFYVPLAQGDSLICPACDRELVVYVRRGSPGVNEVLKAALEDIVCRGKTMADPATTAADALREVGETTHEPFERDPRD